ncbi:MAG: transglutaminase-like domain-containing protein [Verrucomicrobia bacterium]|nr:transglutaminase-like domain-containing protein [Verrucomicrobiota bacterium]
MENLRRKSFGELATSIFDLFVMCAITHAADVGWTNEVLDALKHAGGNRSELETALRTVKGKDTEYLITHASQYDLVNLNCQQIVENVTYARKVHESLPYLGKKLEDGLWRDWVLPHRVLDEDVGLWRKDLHERMQPVVKGKESVREVVQAIHTWLMVKDGSGVARIVYGTVNSESRCRTPMQMFKIGGGGCGELSMMFVYLLRAVGIPARHCLTNWRFDGDALHYYCE